MINLTTQNKFLHDNKQQANWERQRLFTLYTMAQGQLSLKINSALKWRDKGPQIPQTDGKMTWIDNLKRY